MTTISEVGQPAIEPERRQPALPGTPSLLIPLIVLSATALTVINLGATAYLYRTMNDLRVVDSRLKQLEVFEQRIIGRIDAMNMGVQGRLEGMSGELQGQFHRINEGIAGMKFVPDPGDAHDADFPVELEDPLLDAPEVALEDMEAPPKANPAYQRTQTADGKVYYRKVR